eukprot:9328068-Pyramimonas_sp.AAC.1
MKARDRRPRQTNNHFPPIYMMLVPYHEFPQRENTLRCVRIHSGACEYGAWATVTVVICNDCNMQSWQSRQAARYLRDNKVNEANLGLMCVTLARGSPNYCARVALFVLVFFEYACADDFKSDSLAKGTQWSPMIADMSTNRRLLDTRYAGPHPPTLATLTLSPYVHRFSPYCVVDLHASYHLGNTLVNLMTSIV